MTKIYQKSVLAMSWLLCCTIILQAQDKTKHAFSIKQCVEYASKNNSTVKNALLDVLIQKQVNRGITAAALPQLSGSVSYTDYFDIPTQTISDFISPAVYGVLSHEQVKNGTTGTVISAPGNYGLIAAQFGSKFNGSAGLQLQQLLFDGQVFVGLQARAASLQFKEKSVAITEDAIKTNIYKIYYQLVVSKTQIDLLDANIARLDKLKFEATQLYKNGFAEKLDLDKLTVQIANLRTEKEKALNSIEIGYLGLKTLMGMPIRDSLSLTDKISEEDIKIGILADSSASPYQARNEYQYLQLAKKLGEYNIKRYKLAYLPTVAFNSAYAKNAYRTKFTLLEKGDWYTTSYFGLSASLSLFDGFNKDAKLRQSRLELKQTENNIENFKLTMDNDIETAKVKYRSAILTLEYQKKNMELAESVYNQTKKKYVAGTGSNTEINTADVDLKTAQTNYINALYDATIAKVDYLKSIGKL